MAQVESRKKSSKEKGKKGKRREAVCKEQERF
jgi:hypothetical protein